MDGERDTPRIGGWLAFFLLTLGVISPAGTLIKTATEAAVYRWGSLTTFGQITVDAALWIIGGIGAVASCGLALMLLRVRRWASVRGTIGGIWSIACFDIVSRSVVVDSAFAEPLLFSLRHPSVGQLRPLIFCVVWTAYLLRSSRVANTYPRQDGYDPALADIFT